MQRIPRHIAELEKQHLLEALKGLREDLQTRLEAATDGMTEADSFVCGEDVRRSWRSWLFDVMSTHGDIARAAIAKAEEPAATLTDTSKSWTPEEWKSQKVIVNGEEMVIQENKKEQS